MIKALPNRIREFRDRAGLTMQALAERAGTSAPQINKLEKGERRMTVDWMIRLAPALGVDPKELLPDAAPADWTDPRPLAGPGAVLPGGEAAPGPARPLADPR